MYGRKHEFRIRGRALWFAVQYCSWQHYGLVSVAGSCNKFQSNPIYSARCCSCLSELPYQSSCSGRLAAGFVWPLTPVTQGVGRGAMSCPVWVRREGLPTGPADGTGLSPGLPAASGPAQWPGLCHGARELPEEHPAVPKPTSSGAPPPSRHCFRRRGHLRKLPESGSACCLPHPEGPLSVAGLSWGRGWREKTHLPAERLRQRAWGKQPGTVATNRQAASCKRRLRASACHLKLSSSWPRREREKGSPLLATERSDYSTFPPCCLGGWSVWETLAVAAPRRPR